MSTTAELNKKIPNSMVSYGNKRLKEVRELSQTKFGNALIRTSVNRDEGYFDVFVRDSVKETEVKDFEILWPMCKVQIFKQVPRKK